MSSIAITPSIDPQAPVARTADHPVFEHQLSKRLREVKPAGSSIAGKAIFKATSWIGASPIPPIARSAVDPTYRPSARTAQARGRAPSSPAPVARSLPRQHGAHRARLRDVRIRAGRSGRQQEVHHAPAARHARAVQRRPARRPARALPLAAGSGRRRAPGGTAASGSARSGRRACRRWGGRAWRAASGGRRGRRASGSPTQRGAARRAAPRRPVLRLSCGRRTGRRTRTQYQRCRGPPRADGRRAGSARSAGYAARGDGRG
ncbi:hypothetical protein DENSPDRAFT_58439 [Dentipellis sp. KUC8613]|nr:hypothetical protein DENSPDRAFT_58439 [Dentipellis sp. KUC8613]